MLQMFRSLVVASIIVYTAVCWCRKVKANDANRLDNLIRKAGVVLGVELQYFGGSIGEEDSENLLSIMDHVCHALYCSYIGASSV